MGWFDFLFNPGGGGQIAAGPGMGQQQVSGITGPMTVGGSGVPQPGGSIYDQLFNSPQFQRASLSSALMSAGADMLKNSGPSTTPKSMLSALGGGLSAGIQGYEGTRDRHTRDLLLRSQLDTQQLSQQTQRGWMDFMRRLAGGQGGAATPTPGGSPGGAAPGGGYYAMLAADESGGNPQSRNPSGAAGAYQFMPQTWAGARAAIPGLPATPGEATPEQQLAAAQWLTQQNHGALSRTLGRTPTGGELRLAHYFGAGGAQGLLGLDPNTTFDQVPDGMLGAPTATVLAQNPNLRGKRVGELITAYRQRFDSANPIGSAGAPPAAAPRPTQTAMAPPPVSAATATTPMPRSPQEVDALRPGTVFIAPDGTARVR